MTDQTRPQGRLDVQRWLGRCMPLQQYERLMTTLLAYHELAGPADTLEARRAANLEKVSDKTLGTLVKSLFESYALPDGFERELLPHDKVNQRIDHHHSELLGWAKSMDEARAHLAATGVTRGESVVWPQGPGEARCAQGRAAKRKSTQGHEAFSATGAGATWLSCAFLRVVCIAQTGLSSRFF